MTHRPADQQASSAAPTRKVTASSGSAAAVAFVLWLLGKYVFHADLPAPVEGLIEFVVPGLAAGVAGWWVRDVEHRPVAIDESDKGNEQ